MAGTTFGRYKLLRLLARGGMAEVYLALLSGVAGFEKRIALKKILPIYTDIEEFSRLFQDEARICVSLNHSNIVQVFDFGAHENEYYLAMEYVDGPDLEKILIGARTLGRQLSIDAVVHIAIRVASALEYAHSLVDQQGRPLDLIHRDVSPPNVLVSVQGEIKLTDFGVARSAQRISQSRPGVVRGKYAYMSPEQLTGDHLDSRSDLFSLGVLLFEMLTNVNPFLGDSDYKTMGKVVACEPGPVTDYRSKVPRGLVRIVERCLRLHPGTRYQTAGQVRRDLAELMFARGVIDDPQIIVNELWSLFPNQLSRRGLSVPRPRDNGSGAISVGKPSVRGGMGSPGVERDLGHNPPLDAESGPDDEHDPEDNHTTPQIVVNPDAIPTQALDGYSATLDAPPLSRASEATLREEENPFKVRGLRRAPRGPVQIQEISRRTPSSSAVLASPVKIDESSRRPPDASSEETGESPLLEGVAVGHASVDEEALASPPASFRDANSYEESREPESILAPPAPVEPLDAVPQTQDPKTLAPEAAPDSALTSSKSPAAADARNKGPGHRTQEEDEFPLYRYVLAAIFVLFVFWFAVNAFFGPPSNESREATNGAPTKLLNPEREAPESETPASPATPELGEPPVETPRSPRVATPVAPVKPAAAGDEAPKGEVRADTEGPGLAAPMSESTPAPKPDPTPQPEP